LARLCIYRLQLHRNIDGRPEDVNPESNHGSGTYLPVRHDNPYNGNNFSLTLNSCVATKMGIGTKLDDFTLPEFDFSAQAPGAAAVGTLSWSQ
jgi:hypothetical protein